MIDRVELAGLADGLLRTDTRRARRILARGERGSAAELRALRDEAFTRLIADAWANVPYYRRVMDERGFRPDDVSSIEDVARFPVLTKEIIRREGRALCSRQLAQTPHSSRRSGGTTGEPITARVTPLAEALETWSYLRGLRWMGWHPAHKRVLFTGGSLGTSRPRSVRDRLRNWATGVVELPAFELARDTFFRYVETVEGAAPCLLTGYASVLRDFADLCDAEGRAPRGVVRVVSTAEQMIPADAAFITDVLGAPVHSFYGCGEANSLGYQLEPGGVYVVPDEHVILEAAKDEPGVDPGSLLVTTLFNPVQPLIRYANGDLGIVAQPDAASKRTRLLELQGRTSDRFLRRDGTPLSGSFAPHLVFVTGLRVRRYQLIQQRLDRVEFRYDPLGDEISAEAREQTARILREHLRGEVEVEFVRTREFVRSPMGKHRIMIREPGVAA